MTDISKHIDMLVNFAAAKGLIGPADRIYAVNRLLSVLGEKEYTPSETQEGALFSSPQTILDRLLQHALAKGTLESDTPVYRDLLDTELMAALTPPPSAVIARFQTLYAKSPESATDWYYAFSRATNYIRTDRVKKDLCWKSNSPWGELFITINLSKPEKDPIAIAAAKKQRQSGYPSCAICPENEGFPGSLSQAARGNHRILPMELGGEEWFWQYSPYVYYNEHCIALNKKHTPMVINRAAFGKLLDFTDILPHYFIGSNADLPIVGGSILSHDHFQGGRFAFPMEKAPVRQAFSVPKHDVSCGVVDWPMSVLRLSGSEKEPILDLAAHILDKWRGYSDESAEIQAFSGETPHNTVTPIARRRNQQYEMDLVLRNNRTTKAHPFGIFHPHEEKHHIKKENIGLIEVMGLAVLPARLKNALAVLAESMAKNTNPFAEHPDLLPHEPWFSALASEVSGKISEEEAETRLRASVDRVFAGCLEDAGVFKLTKEGQAALNRFLAAL